MKHKIGIIMNGVTGRMGTNQHLERSIVAIINQGGIKINSDDVIIPDPVLVGRNETKLKDLAKKFNIKKYTTDLDLCLSDTHYPVYFDAQITSKRAESLKKAMSSGKAIYCEKPVAANLSEALEICRLVKTSGVKNGVVQDKLWLPGIQKLKYLIDKGFFGKILSVRGEFGYWVFTGKDRTPQRPSWNYRKEDGGSIIIDMFPHWRYLIDNLFGNVTEVSCLGTIDVERRLDENGNEFTCTADDAAYSTFVCNNGIICRFNSSWTTRVRRDDLLTIQVDGTKASAVAGLRKCRIQKAKKTPRFVWNPDENNPIDPYENWSEVLKDKTYENAFKSEWKLFLRHIITNEPFKWTLIEGAKGVQLAELALKSWKEKRFIKVPELVA